MNKPYTTWTVGETEYKLRLTTRQAVAVEEKLGLNLLKVFMPKADEEVPLPPLKVMLVVAHGALQKFHHGTKLEDVYDIFDDYVDNGGSQVSFLTDIILPLFEDSGFIPRSEGNGPKAPTLTVVK